MNHIDEHTIELSIVAPERLHAATLVEIREHLARCPGCRAVEEAQREFYATMVTAGALEKDLLAEVMKKIIPSATTIRLIPFRPRPDMHTLHGRYTTVLAAMTPRTLARGFDETVATLASEPENTLVRIRREGDAHAYRLYVHTEDPHKREVVLISLPDIGEFVTDDRGQVGFELQPAMEPRDWSQIEGLLRIPVATVTFGRNDLPLEKSIAYTKGENDHHCTIEVTNNGDLIRVRVYDEGNPALPAVALVKTPSDAVLSILIHGAGEFPAGEGDFVLRLYG